jgi:hypothetical protein
VGRDWDCRDFSLVGFWVDVGLSRPKESVHELKSSASDGMETSRVGAEVRVGRAGRGNAKESTEHGLAGDCGDRGVEGALVEPVTSTDP